jgi:hypothetical protein
MKLFKIALPFALLLSLPLSASADPCSWTNKPISHSPSSASVDYFCTINGSVVATKTVSTRAVGASACSISLNSGVYNKGTCDSPNITTSACPNSGVVYGVFVASQWSNNISSIEQLCGACGYNVSLATPPGPNETHLRVTCK